MVGFELKRHSRYLALAGHLVLGKENPGNMSKRLEEFLTRIEVNSFHPEVKSFQPASRFPGHFQRD